MRVSSVLQRLAHLVILIAIPVTPWLKGQPVELSSDSLQSENRQIEFLEEAGKAFVRLSETPGSGVSWLSGSSFSEGTVEVDIRGKNVPQQSFVGIAFHGDSLEGYEAVYFRPFNFRSPEEARRSHSVQYICEPTYTWQKLRQEHPGVFENALPAPPDPESWFHARLEVTPETVRVFLDDSNEPVLSVKRLCDRSSGKVGLWAGNGSGGDFANLSIR